MIALLKKHPKSGIRHLVSGIQHPVSSIWSSASRLILFISLLVLLFGSANPLFAQFEVPEFEKMNTPEERAWFEAHFDNISWTGRGLNRNMPIDNVRTHKLRARLQAVFGSPTKTIEDLIGKPNFRPAKAIQFEYWFVVNDSIPLMLLDVDGPFGHGLVYVGASRYIDLMPQIKRTLSYKLMSVDSLAAYQDYFYSPERAQWFDVRYQNGQFSIERIDSPPGMTYDY